ncbi:hypothetical protein B0T24DRAFT_618842 [Lasiosphaeria ovina]|uniref:Uncharacterized protein n=1 Tax=Lasiosphaeria ovina TaxID=92902 RepID=A0AAE0KHS9_9PEZI|nr:hypothetical protein B0T24DRAFT_618842 [Lasiosphaeria ovina]
MSLISPEQLQRREQRYNSPPPLRRHVELQARCGACGDDVLGLEWVVALSEKAGSDTCQVVEQPFLFPLHKTKHIVVGGVTLCLRSGCNCERQVNVTVHHECLAIFLLKCTLERGDALARLFTVGAARSPWPMAHPLHLSGASPVAPAALDTMASICNLGELTRLPLELVEMIQQHCPHLLFWRAVSTLALAAHLSATPAEPATSMPVSNVASWERRGALRLCCPDDVIIDTAGSSEAVSPLILSQAVIRFTIDAKGICKLERLPERPSYSRERTNRLAFIVEEVSALEGFTACFTDGLLQLQPPPNAPALRIWDTPSPPSLSQCTIFVDRKRPWLHFRTIELDSVTGITFFHSKGLLVGIHAHRPGDACAAASFESIKPRHRRNAAWIYLPVSATDQIEIIGVRPVTLGVNILVRKHLTGDVILGPGSRRLAADTWRRKNPTTLVYGEPPEGSAVPYLGTYCRPSAAGSSRSSCSLSASSDPRAHHERQFAESRPLNDLVVRGVNYVSSASLNKVVAAQVFYAEAQDMPEGILLHYDNGASSALGQVRVGVDSSVTVLKPIRVFFWFQPPRARVMFVSNLDDKPALADDPDPESRMKCKPMAGTIFYGFSEYASKLAVRD